ncbi:MAG: DUF2818 family protein [Bordetella sp.]|nr:MAG: DUF2818 family protein [Bordetella sp.]
MDVRNSSYIFIIIAFFFANFSILNKKTNIFFISKKSEKFFVFKLFLFRLSEMLIFYVLLGFISLFLEKNAGEFVPKSLQFYIVTLILYLTIGYPSFVYIFLTKKQSIKKLR